MKSRPISVTPFPLQNLTSKPGCYSLIIDLQRGKKIRVGKLGVAFFPRGIYVYTGSAMSGLHARLRRHVTRKKKRHWHIDYLLASPEARIEKILCYPPAPGQECRQNQRIAALAGASVMLRRFGASDCNAGCASHLFFFQRCGAKIHRWLSHKLKVGIDRCQAAKNLPLPSQSI